MHSNRSVSVIIPTLNAEENIANLIQSIRQQTVSPIELIIADSSSDDNTCEICSQFDDVSVFKISRGDFNHGTTRDYYLRQSKGEYILFMTQDALPVDNKLIERLLSCFDNEQVAAAFARQLPNHDATQAERIVRGFNYPGNSYTRSLCDLQKYGIKTYFLSDVCAMYNREIYLSVGGFEHGVKTNEDMFFSAAALKKGYLTAYCAEAAVYHSHNLSLKEQFDRNYIQGFEIERHKELLGSVAEISEGTKLAVAVSKQLLEKGRFMQWIRFCMDACMRFVGNKLGKRAAKRMNK